MRRKLSLLIAFVGVLGLLGLAPTANANHDLPTTEHDGQPTPPVPDPGQGLGECTVQGEVDVANNQPDGGGVDTTPRHNHFFFQETAITCTNVDNMEDYEGDFAVNAAGATDGPEQAGQHGETDALGWSHKSDYVGTGQVASHKSSGSMTDLYDGQNTNGINGECNNCGEIEVFGDTKTSTDPNNVVMFLREGSTVEAWGILNPDNGKKPVCFLAELEFIPEPKVGQPVNEATLVGDAQVWLGDKVSCGIENEGAKK